MSFTTTDLASIEAAIIALAGGSRVERVIVDGEVINYTPATIQELLLLRDKVKAEVEIAAGTVTLRTYAKNGGRGL